MSVLQEKVLQIKLRADRNDDNALISTFVQNGALIPKLRGFNNCVLYGRRGTGKTHVLRFLKATIDQDGDWGIYIDMRRIGSSDSIYSDVSLPIHQRTISLLSDVLKEIHDGIIDHITSSDENFSTYIGSIGTLLKDLVIMSNEKRIKGDYSISKTVSSSEKDGLNSTIEMGLSDFHLGLQSSGLTESSYEEKTSCSGSWEPYIDFQYLYAKLNEITQKIAPHKLWILVDEFSAINSDLQVYLADMFRIVLAPNPNIAFIIAAIKHRTSLIQRLEKGGYRGLEEGADLSSIDLDYYLVFGNNEAQSCIFFRNLILNHVNSLLGDEQKYADSSVLIKELFTQENAFIELVNAAEGVPRDAINILANAVTFDYGNKVSIPTVRKAAKMWYQEDKQKSVEGYPGASDLLNWIIQHVIGDRHAKAFLLQKGVTNDLINYLFDSRILHVIKQGISSHDTPGIKYDAFSIDYGCYCDLYNTAKFPKGLFEVSDEESELDHYVDVPKDDYRSIRRAILDLDEYEATRESSY